MEYQPTYLGEIDLSEDTLAHYGVKGMKWRRRRNKSTSDKKKVMKLSNMVRKSQGLGDYRTTPSSSISAEKIGRSRAYGPNAAKTDEERRAMTTQFQNAFARNAGIGKMEATNINGVQSWHEKRKRKKK